MFHLPPFPTPIHRLKLTPLLLLIRPTPHLHHLNRLRKVSIRLCPWYRGKNVSFSVFCLVSVLVTVSVSASVHSRWKQRCLFLSLCHSSSMSLSMVSMKRTLLRLCLSLSPYLSMVYGGSKCLSLSLSPYLSVVYGKREACQENLCRRRQLPFRDLFLFYLREQKYV